nr:putative late blight resistance protein homolog R1A-10 [Ipomoea trifida]
MPNISNPDNDIVVGFKKEEEIIIDQLIHGSKEREVVLISGMGGLGKTTLAKRVYEEKIVVNYFDKRAWCTVSQEYDCKDLLCKIYNQVCGKETEIDSVGEELRKKLMGMRYLIVLDDIWSVEAWEDLNRVFPECDNGSKIVLTSRQESVVSDAKHICLPFFTIDESWELLQVKLFKGKGCSKELENVGREISNKCKGLPLTVGLIAGLLEKVEKSEQKWREFLITLNSHVSFGDGIKSNDAIELSYKYLSRPLKSCLLYFAAFPEDEEIEVSKLIELWISEGFITGMTERGRVEDEAEDYLNNLVCNNLIMVSGKKYDGRILSCRVHDLIRDFCLTKAREDIFLEEKSRSVMIEEIRACSKELQTLDWRCPLTPNHEHLLRELPYLRTLICVVSSSESFPKIDFLHHLEKLELIGYNNESQPHLLNVLKLNKFPSSVKEICLTWITLSVSAISTIAQLPNLENLSLSLCTFEGLTWNVGEETKFQKLKRLKISWDDDIEIWNISSAAESFPCLEQLELIFCTHLQVMPSGFEDVLTLKMISVCHCNPIVDSWMKEIEECVRELGNEQLEIRFRRERPARECTKRATARLQAADADAEAAAKERRKKAAARKERPLLNIKAEFSVEEFETTLITPNNTLADIHIPLLKVYLAYPFPFVIAHSCQTPSHNFPQGGVVDNTEGDS